MRTLHEEVAKKQQDHGTHDRDDLHIGYVGPHKFVPDLDLPRSKAQRTISPNHGDHILQHHIQPQRSDHHLPTLKPLSLQRTIYPLVNPQHQQNDNRNSQRHSQPKRYSPKHTRRINHIRRQSQRYSVGNVKEATSKIDTNKAKAQECIKRATE